MTAIYLMTLYHLGRFLEFIIQHIVTLPNYGHGALNHRLRRP